MRYLIPALVAIIVFCLTSISSAMADNSMATVVVTMVDADGAPIELLHQRRIDEEVCERVVGWSPLATGNSFNNGPNGWCLSGVVISVNGKVTRKTPGEHTVRPNTASFNNADAKKIAEMVNGKVTFKAFPNIGSISLTTDPIGDGVFYGEVDSTTFKAGEDNEVRVVMHRLPIIEISSTLCLASSHGLLDFSSKKSWRLTRVSVCKRDSSMGGATTGFNPSGKWVVSPGVYKFEHQTPPADTFVKITRNGEATKDLDFVAVGLDDEVMISVSDRLIE